MSDCPDDTELAGFLNESLPGDRLGPVSGHVDACPLCQARLDRLTEQTGGAVARYKELSSNVLPDAKSGAVSSPEENTLVLGGRQTLPASALVGLPRVPGFDVVAEIGRGGMGVVYKARHRRLNRLVALKMILAGTAADPRVVQRFMTEAEVLACIQHPQVVQVFEVDTYQGPSGVPIPYLAMELLEGGSLSRKLREHNTDTNTGPRWPTPRAAAELVEGLARAVHAAHLRGVIHRDLKPGNILFPTGTGARGEGSGASQSKSDPSLAPDPSPLAPKVMDFGLAKFTRDAGADLTQTGQVVGTPQYMAPEQAAGSRDLGPGADVYALGAILFECLAGRPPFTGTEPMSVLLKVIHEAPPDVRTLRPDAPRDLAAVTMKCLEKDPGRRYASAEALADDLRRFLDDRPTRARPVTNRERAWLWAKRNPAVAGLVAALAVVLVTAFVTVASLWVKAEDKADDEQFAKRRSEAAEATARKETEKAEESLRKARSQEALLEFGRAVRSCEEGRVEDGLALFLRTAELAEQTGQTDLARVARVNFAAWPRDLPPTARPLQHTHQPRLAAFHPDGKHVVTAGRGAELYLWDTVTRERVRIYKPVPSVPFSLTSLGPVTYWSVAISPDGRTIAAAGTDRTVTLWDIGADKPRTTLPIPGPEASWSVGFSSNDMLWSNDGKHGVMRWDLTADPPRVKASAPAKPFGEDVLQILCVSPDGKRVYTGDRGAKVREWDAETVAELRSWPLHGWITDLAVSPDGTRLAATGTEGVVWLLDLTAPAAAPRVALQIGLAGAYGNGVAFAPKRPFLVATDGDGNVRFWHRDTGQPIGIPMRFQGEVTRPRFRPDSDEFAVPAGDSVYLSGVPDPPGDLISAGRGHRLRGLDFSPTGDRLAVHDEFTFELFDPLNAKRHQFAPKAGKPPFAIRYDADPARPFVYRGTRDGFDRLAVPDGQKTEQVFLSRVLGRVYRLESLPGPGRLYAMGEWGVARFDPETLASLGLATLLKDAPAGLGLDVMAVRPDGGEVLVAYGDQVVVLKGDTLARLRAWKVGDGLLDARYTPDGTKVLVARRDNVAQLLDAVTGEPTGARPMPHTRGVTSVAVGPDGTVLLTGSRDGTARFWCAATGLPLGAPLRHTGPVTHVAFSPKGDHVATGTGGGHVMVWDLPPAPATGTIEELRARQKR